jgi:hypothetical protein
MNCGQSGTATAGSIFSGRSPQSCGWCQHRSCLVLSRCARIPARSLWISATSCSRVNWSRSSSMSSWTSFRAFGCNPRPSSNGVRLWGLWVQRRIATERERSDLSKCGYLALLIRLREAVESANDSSEPQTPNPDPVSAPPITNQESCQSVVSPSGMML